MQIESYFETYWCHKLLRSTPKNVFVIVPIDKAFNSVVVTCKGYYVEAILNEIGVIGYGNNTYCKLITVVTR